METIIILLIINIVVKVVLHIDAKQFSKKMTEIAHTKSIKYVDERDEKYLKRLSNLSITQKED